MQKAKLIATVPSLITSDLGITALEDPLRDAETAHFEKSSGLSELILKPRPKVETGKYE